MNIDIDSLSLPELKRLKKNVDKAVDGFGDRQKQEAIQQLEARAKELGFASLSTLFGRAPSQPAGTKKPILPKYRNPDNAGQTWSGRGRRPAWFSAALLNRISPDDMLI